jgi:hypothetical protein
MAINSIITPDDLKKTENVDPGWYLAEIVSYDEAVTKGSDAKPSDGSTNAIYEFKLLVGDWSGKVLRAYFNEKSLHWGKNLWAVLFGMDTRQGTKITSDMLRSGVGHKLQIYVGKNKAGYDSVVDYKPE